MDDAATPESTADQEIAHLRARVAALEAELAARPAAAAADDPDSRALLDTLFARTPVGLAFLDHELRYIRINETLAEMNGRSPAAHLGRRIDEVIPELVSQIEPFYRHVLSTGEPVLEIETRGVTPDRPGLERDWLVSYYPVPDTAGSILGVGVVVVEITERKQAEEALALQAEALYAQAERLRLANDAAELGTWRHDHATDMVYLDARARAHYGFSADAVPLGALLARVHPEDREPFAQLLAGAAAAPGNARYHAEYRVVDPDGALRWLAIGLHSNRVEREGAPAASFGTGSSQDITTRRLMEEEAHRSARRLQTLHTIDRAILLAETPEHIATVVASRLQQLVPCDRVVVAAYEPEQQRIKSLALTDVQPERLPFGPYLPIEPRDLEAPFALHQRWYVPDTERAPALAPRAIDHRRAGFRSVLHLPLVAEGQLLGLLRLGSLAPEAFSEADLVVAGELADQLAIVLRGAGMREQLEQERTLLARRVAERTADLRAANLELARAARLKDEFLANMSHELRTPLNAILGRAELLREQVYGPMTERQSAAARSIEEAGSHLLELINDILDLSKVEAGMLQLERAPLDVEALCHAATRMVAEAAVVKRLALSSSYDSRLGTLIADERRLKQILVNLLANAVKFTPAGGKVGLEVAGDPEQQTLSFTVWDTGIGIAPEDRERMFKPFVQLDSALNREQAGTGLGLALVQRLTELHGGSVQLESTVGVGSRFRIVVPWERPAAPAPAAPEPAWAAPRRALIIDDSPQAAEQVARHLRELDVEVAVHGRAEGAVERAAALQPDLIVLDILLPGQSGWELLRLLKADARTAAIAVVVASVVDDPASARALGAAAALRKPVGREALRQALQGLRAHPAALAAPAPARGGPDAPLLLLAEDNVENVRVLADYLSTAGYALVVAHNGAEAVALAEDRRPALILMDIQMPVMDGLEATRRIRAAGLGATPIIAVTALAMPGDRERCLEAGADDYLTKPVGLRALRELIERHLRR